MTFDELLTVYGSQAEIARVYSISRASVNRWAKTGKVPELGVLQFERTQSPAQARQTRKQLQIAAARRWADKG